MESGPLGNEDLVGGKGMNNGGGTSSNFLCRQSSTRWTPTTDQIRILKDLYYNNGVRSPTAEQIQRISAKLRQYGKIEGKNVFYWFQNHKARERQKKRFTSTTTDHLQFNIPNVHCYRPPQASGPGFLCKDSNNINEEYHHVSSVYNNFPKMNTTAPQGGCSSTGLLTGGSMCNYGYGSMAMEKSFRECSITPAGGNVNGGLQNITWVGVNDYPYSYPFHEKRKYMINEDRTLEMEEDHIQQQEEEEEDSTTNHAIETLPLFPMHAEINKHQTHHDYFFNSYGINNGSASHDCWYNSEPVTQASTCPRASLELTLNSCGFANLNN